MKKTVMTTVAALMIAAVVQAEEPSLAELQKQLNELAAKIEQLESKNAELEKKNAEKMESIQKENAARIAAIKADNSAKIDELKSAAPMELPSWVTNTKFKGDFRYRYENIEKASANYKDRQRVRLRVGAYGKVNDFADYGIRVATGGNNPTSANVDIGDNGTGKKEVRLDRYYVDLHPDMLMGSHLIMGKMGQPWINRTGLIWDSDLNPEGLALTYENTFSNGVTLIANAGSFVLYEDKSDDLQLWAGQLAAKTKVSDAKVTLGVSDFYYQRADRQGAAGGLVTGHGNTAGTDFHLVEGFGSVEINPGIPVAFNGQYVVNVDAATSDDTAYLVGVKLGKAKHKGDWEAGYNWRDTGADAVPDGFNDSDFAYGTTASSGHSFWAKYQIAKNLQAGATYLMAKNNLNQDVNTLQLDLNFKF